MKIKTENKEKKRKEKKLTEKKEQKIGKSAVFPARPSFSALTKI